MSQELQLHRFAIIFALIASCAGCSTTTGNFALPSIPNIKNPVRVAPPATGSYSIHPPYSKGLSASTSSNVSAGSFAENAGFLANAGSIDMGADSAWHPQSDPPSLVHGQNPNDSPVQQAAWSRPGMSVADVRSAEFLPQSPHAQLPSTNQSIASMPSAGTPIPALSMETSASSNGFHSSFNDTNISGTPVGTGVANDVQLSPMPANRLE